MLAALVTVLALAGAPPSTRVVCDPALPSGVELGLTISDEAQIVGGVVVQGPLDHIILGTTACGGLLYASLSPSVRRVVRRMNPGVNFDYLAGVGLQVALHEAEHVALNSTNECLVEKTARSKIDDLLSRVGDPGRVALEESAATASDASLPATYRDC